MSTVETVREIIRGEVAKARPVADSRRAIELIAESSIRFRSTDAVPRIEVMDMKGEPRLTAAGAPFTLQDFLAEIRLAHPALFETSPPAPERPLVRETASPESPVSGAKVLALPVARDRDWLLVRPGAGDEVPSVHVASSGSDAPPASVAEAAAHVTEASPAKNDAPANHSGAPRAPVVANDRWSSRPAVPRGLIAATAAGFAILAGGAFGYWLTRPTSADVTETAALASSEPRVAAAPMTTPTSVPPATQRPADPPATGSVKAADAEGALVKGVPEVIDTATLSVSGKVMPLFGVEWVRGAGDPADLTSYLRKREVSCRPAANEASSYRCEVDGQDLSKVVLYNGGGRATSTATPDLQAAEAHAKAARIGFWGR